MRAVLLSMPGGPESLELVEWPDVTARSGEVVVRAEVIGLGRPDVMMRTGKYKWMPPLPAVIGNELVGRVSRIGDGVDAAWLGRRVLVSSRELDVRGGCYAEEIAVPADALIDLPESVDALAAVCLPNYQLAWGLLHDATRGRVPRRVYVNGAAGGVGMALLDTCRMIGVEAIAGAGSAEKREFTIARGASAAVDTQLEPKQLVRAVLEANGGRGVDAALDHAGGASFTAHLDMLNTFGLLVSYNALAGVASGDPFADLRARASKALGITAYNMHAYNGPAMREVRRGLLRQAIGWMARREIAPEVRTFPLAQVREAHALIDSARFTGKLALVP